MTQLGSVRNPRHADAAPHLTPLDPPVLYFQPPVSSTLAVSRASHRHSPSLLGKGSSSPHLWVSMDTWISLGRPLCPEAASISHGAHPSCLLACSAHTPPGLTLQHQWLPGFSRWLLTRWLSDHPGSLSGGYRAWHSSVHVSEPGAHWARCSPASPPCPVQVGALPGAEQGSNFVIPWPCPYRLPKGKPSHRGHLLKLSETRACWV